METDLLHPVVTEISLYINDHRPGFFRGVQEEKMLAVDWHWGSAGSGQKPYNNWYHHYYRHANSSQRQTSGRLTTCFHVRP